MHAATIGGAGAPDGGNMVKMEARVFGCVEMNRNIRGVDKVFVRSIWKYGSAYVI